MNKLPCSSIHLKRALAATLAALLLAFTTACHKTTLVITTAAGHQITAVIEGDHSIESNSGQGMIASRFGKIIIEPWAKIPEDVPVEVRIASRKITLTAGNVTVSRAN